jgi:hypothetical protein
MDKSRHTGLNDPDFYNKDERLIDDIYSGQRERLKRYPSNYGIILYDAIKKVLSVQITAHWLQAFTFLM